MEKYVIVMVKALIVVLKEKKRKGHITHKEKLHILHFCFFILNDFCKHVQLEYNSNHNRKEKNIISGCQSIV
jgi:hypothetical protein